MSLKCERQKESKKYTILTIVDDCDIQIEIFFSQDQLHGDVYECDALGAVDFVHCSIRLCLDLQELHSNLLIDKGKNDNSL